VPLLAYVVTATTGVTCTCNICSKDWRLGAYSFCRRYSASTS
jgi:hypothetical protein